MLIRVVDMKVGSDGSGIEISVGGHERQRRESRGLPLLMKLKSRRQLDSIIGAKALSSCQEHSLVE